MANSRAAAKKRKASPAEAESDEEFPLTAEFSDGSDFEDDENGEDEERNELDNGELESEEESEFEDEPSFSDAEEDTASQSSFDTKDDKDKHGDDRRSSVAARTKTLGGDEDEEEDTPNYVVTRAADGGIRYEYKEIDPVYDSDDTDANEPVNTIGNIPLSFYDSYPHIGYDINGKKIMRPATGEALDALLDSIEIPKGWTGLTDPATGKPLKLTQEELELLRRVQMNEVPEDGFDPYPEMVEYFTGIEEKFPLSAADEPKRRFVPSKHEAKRIMKMVRAIREGRILPYKPPEEREKEAAEEEEAHYDLWQDEQPRLPHVMHLPAPKLPPPGYDLSYNPPPEYLPSKAERGRWENTDPEEREKGYLPQKFDALRKVPGYEGFVKERFERCLDLYLAPRVRKNRLNIDPASLLPKLPRPAELRPFPTREQMVLRGHTGPVRSVSIDPSGNWIASGGDDGVVRVWSLRTGYRVAWSVRLSPGSGEGDDHGIKTVRWRPRADAFILAATAGDDVFFMIPMLGPGGASDSVLPPQVVEESIKLLDAGFGHATTEKQLTTASGQRKEPVGRWARPGAKLEDQGVRLKVTLRSPPRNLEWHRGGNYLVTVSPAGKRSAVAIHALNKHQSMLPLRKFPGLPEAAAFHPSKPHLFVASRQMVRVYDLQRQVPARAALQPGARWIAGIDIHPATGDHVLLPCYDRRLLWHDLDQSPRPYRTMRFHDAAIRVARFHRSANVVPLLADGSDDGSVQVYHARVLGDSMEGPTIVPVKSLRGHTVGSNRLGVMDLAWHPTEPVLVSAGGDGTLRVWR